MNKKHAKAIALIFNNNNNNNMGYKRTAEAAAAQHKQQCIADACRVRRKFYPLPCEHRNTESDARLGRTSGDKQHNVRGEIKSSFVSVLYGFQIVGRGRGEGGGGGGEKMFSTVVTKSNLKGAVYTVWIFI